MNETTNRSRIPCEEHPREEITNYCCNLHCLKPLCPDCVEIHTKSHSKQEIESWKNCLNNTLKQLKNTHYRLKEIQNKLGNERSGASIQSIEEQAIKTLKDLRKQIHQMVDDIFDHHQKEIRNIIRNEFKSTPLDLSKLKVAIQEIQKLMMKLSNSGTVIPALKKSILLDHQALISHFQQQYRNAPAQVSRDQFFVNVDQQDITKLRRNLQRLINYDSADAADTKVIKNNYNSYVQQEQLFNLPKQGGQYERGLVISKQDYFYETSNKFLHFFVPFSNHLKLLHLSQLNNNPLNWKTIKLSMTGVIPSFYKSIITPSGQIFLTGGKSNQKLSAIYRFNSEKSSLQFMTDMAIARSSHSICYMNGDIYIIGGFKSNDDTAKQCQIYNIQTRRCRTIGSLCHPSANCCTSAFNNQYIFKFGGIFQSGQPSHFIEIYSIRDKIWTTIDPYLERYTQRIWITSFSAAVQINSNQIFIFGGYNDLDSQVSSTMSYTLFVQKKGTQNLFSLRNIGTYPLPQAEGFWDNTPIIAGNQVIALQNVSDVDNTSAVVDERSVLIFNGRQWAVA